MRQTDNIWQLCARRILDVVWVIPTFSQADYHVDVLSSGRLCLFVVGSGRTNEIRGSRCTSVKLTRVRV